MDGEDALLPVSIFDICPYAESRDGAGGSSFLVFLKGQANRVVPINIGHFEGQALFMALRKIPLPRPLPHNLLLNLLGKLNAAPRRLVIHTLEDEVFLAHLLIETSVDSFWLDCRPSDGMIVAALTGIQVYMTPQVMAEAGRDLEREPGATGAGCQPGPDGGGAVRPACACRGAAAGGGPTPQSAPREATELERLNEQLTRLIAEEAYEEAARVRDRIRALAAG